MYAIRATISVHVLCGEVLPVVSITDIRKGSNAEMHEQKETSSNGVFDASHSSAEEQEAEHYHGQNHHMQMSHEACLWLLISLCLEERDCISIAWQGTLITSCACVSHFSFLSLPLH